MKSKEQINNKLSDLSKKLKEANDNDKVFEAINLNQQCQALIWVLSEGEE